MILLHGMDEQRKPFDTYLEMIYIARGCEDYEAAGGQWPDSIPNSFDSRYGVTMARDPWGNDIAFVPYIKAVGYGELISYGRDGKPGGSGLDRDWVMRFPIRQNYEWDKKQAMEAGDFRNLKHYDWFDSKLSDADRPTTNDSSTNALSK
jgi:hypothetical protein